MLTNLLDKNEYQIFLLACPGNLPLSFAAHPWLVVNQRGLVSRWEILFRTNLVESSWGHLHKNFLPAFQGIEILPYNKKLFWPAWVLGMLEGDKAKLMAEFIENSYKFYPYCYQYSLTGPNSNTYIQWVLNHFKDFPVKLPWNCFGKNYLV